MIEKKCWIIHSSHIKSCNEKAIIKNIYAYRDDILAHVEHTSNKELRCVKSNLITFVDNTTSKRKIWKKNRFCDMNFNSIEKKNKLDKKPISVIDCFSDESTLSSKSDIDKVANIHRKKRWIEHFKEKSKRWW